MLFGALGTMGMMLETFLFQLATVASFGKSGGGEKWEAAKSVGGQ